MGADFRNIELEVRSAFDLTLLAKAFGKKFYINFCDWIAPSEFMLSGAWAMSGLTDQTPDSIAIGLCKMIQDLNPAGKRIWRKASERVFDVGLDATVDRKVGLKLFEQGTASAIGKLGVRIAVTVYAHDLEKKGRGKVGAKFVTKRGKRKGS